MQIPSRPSLPLHFKLSLWQVRFTQLKFCIFTRLRVVATRNTKVFVRIRHKKLVLAETAKTRFFNLSFLWLQLLDKNDLPKESKIEWTKAQNRRSSVMQRPTAAVFYFGVKSCKTNKLKIVKIFENFGHLRHRNYCQTTAITGPQVPFGVKNMDIPKVVFIAKMESLQLPTARCALTRYFRVKSRFPTKNKVPWEVWGRCIPIYIFLYPLSLQCSYKNKYGRKYKSQVHLHI